MNIAVLCVLLAYVTPYLFVLAAKTGKGLDNAKPREYLENVKGWRRRAHWTQLNHFENFAPFAAAVILSLQTGVNMNYINGLAISFVICRLIYGICYIADIHMARSIVWFLAQICIITLFVMAIG